MPRSPPPHAAQSFEALNQRAVAVVVDPVQSVKGKVVIDAFRLISPQTMMLGQEPRQTTSNLGHLNKPSIQALIHGLNRHYYSIAINYRCGLDGGPGWPWGQGWGRRGAGGCGLTLGWHGYGDACDVWCGRVCSGGAVVVSRCGSAPPTSPVWKRELAWCSPCRLELRVA